MVGRQVLKVMVAISITCEVIGSVGLGVVLLIFYRENPFSVLFSSAGIPDAASWHRPDAARRRLRRLVIPRVRGGRVRGRGGRRTGTQRAQSNHPRAAARWSCRDVFRCRPNPFDSRPAGAVAAQSGDMVADTLAAHLAKA